MFGDEVWILVPLMALSIPIIAILTGYARSTREQRAKERMARSEMTEEDAASFARTLERLEQRMKTLEAILDDEVPGWRRKYDD